MYLGLGSRNSKLVSASEPTKEKLAYVEAQSCSNFRTIIKQEVTAATILVVPKCKLIQTSNGQLLIHNDFNEATNYKILEGDDTTDKWTMAYINSKYKKSVDKIIFTPNSLSDQSIVLLEGNTVWKGFKILKQFVVSSEKALPTTSNIDTIDSFVDNSKIILKQRNTKEIGKSILRSQQVNIGFKRTITKGKDKQTTKTTVDLQEQNKFSFMYLHPAKVELEQQNTDSHIILDKRLFVTENIYGSQISYVKQVGSILSFCLFIFWIVTSTVSVMFTIRFIRDLAQIINKKYLESYYLNQIKRHLFKFRKIYNALIDRKNEPEYQEIFTEIEQFLQYSFDQIDFEELKDLFSRMRQLDELLPDLEEVETIIPEASTLDMPESQKILNQKIDEVIAQKAKFNLSQIM